MFSDVDNEQDVINAVEEITFGDDNDDGFVSITADQKCTTNKSTKVKGEICSNDTETAGRNTLVGEDRIEEKEKASASVGDEMAPKDDSALTKEKRNTKTTSQ